MTKASKQARADRLESIRKQETVGTVDAAIYLDVSKRTLERWRDHKGLGPKFIAPIVPPGEKRTTQHFKYRVAELDAWQRGRESPGGFQGMFFATNTAWAMNDQGQILGDAFSIYAPSELDQAFEEDRVDVMTLAEAVEGRWTNAEALAPYVDDLISSMKAEVDRYEDAARAALQAQQLRDTSPEPPAPSIPIPRP